ncbi:hypothetical protein CK203_087613 [Vitis vinifera]|uniref:DUF7650 domain-containing protein n=1 Tax=Vitis vinifera TaxID=29760 RepID=A0A438EZS8_VITVI|nr:hypothetical protein CK203_087613 [Vitis vinifera]
MVCVWLPYNPTVLTLMVPKCQSCAKHVLWSPFVEGRTSLAEYVSSLKITVGICNLIEAVGVGKGKDGLTGIVMEPIKIHHFFCSCLAPLLARGWHSEQPKNEGCASSKHSLVFLVPGVKKFSRRKLVKGDHYFDSISDVLSKVASEPKILELEDEETGVSSCKEGNGWVPEAKLDNEIHLIINVIVTLNPEFLHAI